MDDLDREDMTEAEGVRQAFVSALTSGGRFDLPQELVCDTIRQGVADAIWRVATNATHVPCADFYDSIKEGVRDGMARFRDDEGDDA